MKDWAALSSEKGHLSPKDMQHGEAEKVPSLGWSDFTLEVFTEPSISPQRTPFLCPQKPDSRSPDSRTLHQPGLQSLAWSPRCVRPAMRSSHRWCLRGSAQLRLRLQRTLPGAPGPGVSRPGLSLSPCCTEAEAGTLFGALQQLLEAGRPATGSTLQL